MTAAGCSLCETLGRLGAPGDEFVWGFRHSVALLGPWQFYHGYCVLVSRLHARELIHLPDEVRRAYLEEMCLLARAIERAFRPHKLNHELLGNQVNHPHWHLFPRSADDPARLSPVWLAVDAAERDPEARRRLQTGPGERSATVADLRRALVALGAESA